MYSLGTSSQPLFLAGCAVPVVQALGIHRSSLRPPFNLTSTIRHPAGRQQSTGHEEGTSGTNLKLLLCMPSS